jgi:uncharacterized glyoxalase superfamily protein PhnB
MHLRPMLDVPDLSATITFWTDVLGFTVGSRLDDDKGRPLWCHIERDGVAVMFTSHYHDDGEDEDEEPHTAALTGSLYVNVDDVDELAAELAPKTAFLFGPETMPHGMREVAVRDNSGYVVVFGTPVPPE